MARARRRHRPAASGARSPTNNRTSPAGLRHRLEHDPVFRILSVDGLNWICPYTGTLVQAPFDWQQSALRWLLDQQPWREHEPRSLEQLERHRWRIHLRAMVTEDPRFRRFDPQGRWLNPYTGTWEREVRREGKTVTGDTLADMARILAGCPAARAGDLLPPERIQGLVDAAKRPASPAASGPAPVKNVPLYAGGDLKISPRHEGSAEEQATRRAIRPSDLIAGYRVLGRIGTGGMSAVYRARQDAEGREVALKVLQAHGDRAEAFAERFIREAQAARDVTHPNVVTVYDFGRDGGKLFMTMELMAGGDVEQLLRREGPLRERRALEILRDVTAGLAALHAGGIIHRDIKPSNLFLDRSGMAKLGDLGLAKRTGHDSTITIDGAAVGTPAFMAPEQAGGSGEVDHRADIYAVGASLAMLLTGRAPFLGGNVFTVVRRVQSEPFPDPRRHNRAVGAATAELIATATAKDPARRYVDAAALAAAIDAAIEASNDDPPRLVDHQCQTATVRHRLSDRAGPDGTTSHLSPSNEHLALERRIDPVRRLADLGLDLGLFEARADRADHHALRLLGDRPLLLLVRSSGIDPGLREEVAAGLDGLIDRLVAAAPESTGALFARFHRHLHQAGLSELAASAVMVSADGEQLCLSVADAPRPLRFGDPAAGVDLRQVAHRDGPLGAHEYSSREAWIDLPPGGGLVLVGGGTLEALDAEGEAFDQPHLAASLLRHTELDAQALAEAIGEDLDHHAEGQLLQDATIVVLKRRA